MSADQDRPEGRQEHDPLQPSGMPPRWQQGRTDPPPPPEFSRRAGSQTNSVLKGLGIACLSCIAVLAGLIGGCFALFAATDKSVYPVIFAAAFVFLAAAAALFFLIRPKR